MGHGSCPDIDRRGYRSAREPRPFGGAHATGPAGSPAADPDVFQSPGPAREPRRRARTFCAPAADVLPHRSDPRGDGVTFVASIATQLEPAEEVPHRH